MGTREKDDNGPAHEMRYGGLAGLEGVAVCHLETHRRQADSINS
jgi:hypothetical protein